MDNIPVLEVFWNAKMIRNDNSSKFREINNWFKNFKFYEEEKDNIFKVLVGILYLKNIRIYKWWNYTVIFTQKSTSN